MKFATWIVSFLLSKYEVDKKLQTFLWIFELGHHDDAVVVDNVGDGIARFLLGYETHE